MRRSTRTSRSVPGVSTARARTVLRSRGISAGYPAEEVRLITSRQGRRTSDESVKAKLRAFIRDEAPLCTGSNPGHLQAWAALVYVLDMPDSTPAPLFTAPDITCLPYGFGSARITGGVGSGKSALVQQLIRHYESVIATQRQR